MNRRAAWLELRKCQVLVSTHGATRLPSCHSHTPAAAPAFPPPPPWSALSSVYFRWHLQPLPPPSQPTPTHRPPLFSPSLILPHRGQVGELRAAGGGPAAPEGGGGGAAHHGVEQPRLYRPVRQAPPPGAAGGLRVVGRGGVAHVID